MPLTLSLTLFAVGAAGDAPEQRAPEEQAPESGDMEPIDPLEALLALPREPIPEAAPTVEVLQPPSAGGESGFLNLGALVLMTAEGNFPQTFLDSDEELTLVLFPGTVAEQTTTVQAWDTDSLLQPGPRNIYPSLVLTAEAEWFPFSAVGFRTFLTTGEIRAGSTLEPPLDGVTLFGEAAEDFGASGLWLGEAEMIAYAGPLTLELGRRYVSVGAGRVFQDVGTGVFMNVGEYELDGGLSAEASVFAVGRRFDALEKPSPMATLALRYEWALVNEVGLFLASFWDRNQAFDDVVRATRAEAVLRGALDDAACSRIAMIAQIGPEECTQFSLNSVLLDESGERAQVTYLGGHVGAQLGSLRVRGNAIVNLGSYEFTRSDASPGRVVLRGFAGDLEASVPLGSSVSVGALGLYYSGYDSEQLSDQTYTSFIAVAPLWTYSTIFFTSGVSQTFTAARAAAAGINGHGVLGGGPRIDWVSDRWRVEATTLALFADEPIDPQIGGGGSFYGLESNLIARWEWSRALGLQAIAGVLVPGSFFPDDALAYRALFMVDGSYEL